MIRHAVEFARLETFAEVGIVLFVFAFLCVIARVLLVGSERSKALANIPLQEANDE